MILVPRRWRASTPALGALGGAGLVAVVLGLLGGHGYAPQHVRLSSGGQWLASDVGQLTFVDGATGQTVAAVPAQKSDDLAAVQVGSDGYAVDAAAGTVERVDGATLATSPVTTMIPGSTQLQLFSASGTLFALDATRGEVLAADPVTLRIRGRQSLVSSSSHGTHDQGVVDAGGRLWLLDPDSGDLSRLDGSAPQVHGHVVTAASRTRLVLDDGRPAVVDLSDRTVQVFGSDGSVQARGCLNSPGATTDGVSGSSTGSWVFAVSEGQLHVGQVGSQACGEPYDVGGSQDRLGPAVEQGGLAFVPDYTTGSVTVVDLRSGRKVASPTVLSTPAPFQLLARDGLVFFNNPANNQAGIIKLDGQVTKVSKYSAADPDAALTKLGRGAAPTAVPSSGRESASVSATPTPATTASALRLPVRAAGRVGPLTGSR